MKGAWYALLAAIIAGCATGAPAGDRVAYVNGRIWDGERFREGDLVVAGGRFVSGSARGAAQTVDLAGGYVVPPFCEAHNHNLGTPYRNEERIDSYLRSGIFYVGTLSNVPRITDPVRDTYNTPTSVDTIFGNGGLTATGGHPIPLREFLLERGIYPGFTRETLADQAYFVIDNEADLERRWPLITGFRPDFIKIFLLFSEEYERRRDPSFQGAKGLDPAIVPRIVERAHAAGLRVFAHVESGHDFHVAITSGVDVIAHLPGDAVPTRVDPADARLAAQRGVPVMTTTLLLRRRREDQQTALREAAAANLRTLRDAGVTLAAGSDETEAGVLVEMEQLRSFEVFSNAELLNMLSRDCARTLFPDRRVGALEGGGEASFIVLESDPTADFTAIRTIRLRVKEGGVLNLPAQPPAPPQN